MSSTVFANIITSPGAFSGHINVTSPSGKLGRLYIEDSGEHHDTKGTLVCSPGIGDVRASYRFVADSFVSRGYRVIVADTRGMGDSHEGFDEFSPETVASDIKEIIVQRGLAENVILVGCSLAAGSVTLVASENIPCLRGIILLGPILHDMPLDPYFKPLTYLVFAGLWGSSIWFGLYSSLYKRNDKPDGFENHLDQIKACFSKGSALSTLGRFFRASKQNVDDIVDKVSIPILAVYGDQDPDYPDFPKEKEWFLKKTANNRQTDVTVLQQVGHYPHVEAFDETRDAMVRFLEKILV